MGQVEVICMGAVVVATPATAGCDCSSQACAIANRIANGILSHGVAAGARVGFLGLNSPDFYFSLIGTAKTRAAFIPFNWRLSVNELAQLLKDSDATLVFVEQALADLWNGAVALAGCTVQTIWFDAERTLEAQFAAQPATRPDLFISEEDIAVQLYTSGTTGFPKGGMSMHVTNLVTTGQSLPNNKRSTPNASNTTSRYA